jgi:8-oxo-dGTP pyrophosphatase MutT (NUDIX family)
MMKKTVHAIIFNDNGEVLSVSRKDNHSDMGLVGGKVDEVDYTGPVNKVLETALIREVKEETGLDINIETAEMVFAIHKNGYMGYTYLIKDWSGDIYTDESHVVRWTNFLEIISGSFGRYNSLVAESLHDLGIKFKMFP